MSGCRRPEPFPDLADRLRSDPEPIDKSSPMRVLRRFSCASRSDSSWDPLPVCMQEVSPSLILDKIDREELVTLVIASLRVRVIGVFVQ